jgi:hypothetical protein
MKGSWYNKCINVTYLQDNAVDNARKFLDALARMSENQLLQFDNELVVDDVEKGRK